MATEYENIAKSNAQKYYTGKPALSDEVFDAVIDEIRSKNPDSEIITTGWGYEVDDNGKVKHKYGHKGSLEKVRTLPQVEKKVGLDDLVLSAKLDGMSVVLYYEKGVLQLALTRGNGEYGIDITEKVKYILGSETIDDVTFTGAVRGELMMKVSQFKEYSKLHPEAKNHRNSAIGLINGDSITDDYKYLTLAVYSVVGMDEYSQTFRFNNKIIGYTYKDLVYTVYDWLKQNFYDVAPMVYIDHVNKNSFTGYLYDLREDWSKYWNIDGIVISQNKLSYNAETEEEKQFAVAWKFGEEIKVTKIKHIEWTMSKSSCYIPVVVFDPIELAGTTVQRATAFNAKFVKDNNLKKDTIIAVAKRGEIIPQIIEVIDV